MWVRIHLFTAASWEFDSASGVFLLSGNSWEFHSSETSVPGGHSRPGNWPWPVFQTYKHGNSPSVPKGSPLACFKNFFFKQLGLKLDVDLDLIAP